MSFSYSGSHMTDTTAAERTIRERIRQQGSITFAEFMQTALYHPVDGYYTSEKPFGAAGDYYTSPAVHPAFGALLAVQLHGMWRCLGKPSEFAVVEMGAGNGMLAEQVCESAARISGEFARSLLYVCLDRYAPAQADQPVTDDARLQWLRADGIPLRNVVGCFISNEFVDAFPVHRFEMRDGEALEVYVALDDAGEFTDILDTPSTPLIAERLSCLGFAIADGQRGEVNLGAISWLNEVASALSRGFVLTIDYGYEAAELYSARRRFGTLRTYYRHTEGSSPYRRIGRQDLTAHVDFSLLQGEGNSLGLNTIAYTTQAELLRSLSIQEMMRQLRNTPISGHERNANLMALRELVKADGLGGFKALIQEKATDAPLESQIAPRDARWGEMPLPLLSSRHMPLMEGRYPHTSWETPALWGMGDKAKGSATPPN